MRKSFDKQEALLQYNGAEDFTMCECLHGLCGLNGLRV